MANKTVTITEPVASDIQAITILYDDTGKATSIKVRARIRTSVQGVSHAGNCKTLPSVYSAAVVAQLSPLATEAAALLAAAENF